MANASKSLGHEDVSGFEFSKEVLCGDQTAGINFDRLMKHPVQGYVIIEYLLCEESQRYVTPYTSHPQRYWEKNKNKFLALWRAKKDFNAKLYLVNYAKKGTLHDDEVMLIEVEDMDETGILKEQKFPLTRKSFSEWFRKMNTECLSGTDEMLRDIYENKTVEELGQITLTKGKYKDYSISAIWTMPNGAEYLKYHQKQSNYLYHVAVEIFLRKQEACA